MSVGAAGNVTREDRFRISSDSHMCEPLDLWEKDLPEKFHEHAIHIRHEYGTGFYARSGAYRPGPRLKDMARDGILAEVLYPTFAKDMYHKDRPPEAAEACARVYNDWLIEFCQESPDRLWGQAEICLWDVDRAIREAERTRSAGLVGSTIWMVPPADIPFSSIITSGSGQPPRNLISRSACTSTPGLGGTVPRSAVPTPTRTASPISSAQHPGPLGRGRRGAGRRHRQRALRDRVDRLRAPLRRADARGARQPRSARRRHRGRAPVRRGRVPAARPAVHLPRGRALGDRELVRRGAPAPLPAVAHARHLRPLRPVPDEDREELFQGCSPRTAARSPVPSTASGRSPTRATTCACAGASRPSTSRVPTSPTC